VGCEVNVAQELIPRLSDETPQPIALALGRVVRAVGTAERLDACIKAAEVVARYVAVASLASAASTREPSQQPPEVDSFVGNLSFGVFENAARASTSVDWTHPLREQLRVCLKSAKKRKAIAGQRLQAFVELRNDLGHAITHVDEARARTLFETNDPVGGLIDLLDGLGPVLACPLLVVLGQEHRRGRFLARVAFFAGEGEPIPQLLELRNPIFEWEMPYLCAPEGLIPLSPGLLYEPRSADGRFGLFLLDGIDADSLRYKSVVDSGVLTRPEGVRDIAAWVRLPFAPDPFEASATRPLLEPIKYVDGRTLHEYLSGAEPSPADGDTEPEESATDNQEGRELADTTTISTLRNFEQRANSVGLGAVYRDVVYFLAEKGAHAELSDQLVRVVTTDEPPRVLATIQQNPGPELSVALLLGPITSGRNEGSETHDFHPGDAADALIARMKSLLDHADRT
jgi:hypothetical protein